MTGGDQEGDQVGIEQPGAAASPAGSQSR